jgi:phosphoribosylamine--glycine ligase
VVEIDSVAQTILVVGGGGREHALVWALRQTGFDGTLLAAPGNPGIAAMARCVPVAADDLDGLVALCLRESVTLAVVGPEAPLVAGLADRLEAVGVAVMGPRAAAAQVEASKGFVKDLCAREGIPTADYARCTALDDALVWLRAHGAPVVVKADGLAAGKGVTVAATLAEAEAAAREALVDDRFGAAGRSLVVEEFLDGEELSLFALCDGTRAVFLATAMDHKRLGDGDTGPNTGGMGAVSPHPRETPALVDALMRDFIHPTLRALDAAGTPFRGVLYAGLMLTAAGPKLLEYNARLGDPECQCLMVRVEGDWAGALAGAARGALDPASLRWRDEPAVCVVLAAPGYPEAPRGGDILKGLDEASAVEGVTVFHAGTRRDAEGVLRSAGGRVLNVVARGATVAEARARAYAAVARIDWPGAVYRRDIAVRALP